MLLPEFENKGIGLLRYLRRQFRRELPLLHLSQRPMICQPAVRMIL